MKFLDMFKIIINNEKRLCLITNGVFYIAIGSQAQFLNEKFELKKICFKDGVCKVGVPINAIEKLRYRLEAEDIPYVVYEYLDDSFENKDNNYTNIYESGDRKYVKTWEYISMDGNNHVDYKKYKCNPRSCKYKRDSVVKELNNCKTRLIQLQQMVTEFDNIKIENDNVYIDGFEL